MRKKQRASIQTGAGPNTVKKKPSRSWTASQVAENKSEKKYVYPNFATEDFSSHSLLHAYQRVCIAICKHVTRTDEFLDRSGVKMLVNNTIRRLEEGSEARQAMLSDYTSYFALIKKYDETTYFFWNFFLLYLQCTKGIVQHKQRTRSWKLIVHHLSVLKLTEGHDLLVRITDKASSSKGNREIIKLYNQGAERKFKLNLVDKKDLALYNSIMNVVDPVLESDPEEKFCDQDSADDDSDNSSNDGDDLSPHNTPRRLPFSGQYRRNIALLAQSGPNHSLHQEVISDVYQSQPLLDSIKTLTELDRLSSEQMRGYYLRQQELDKQIERHVPIVIDTRRSLLRLLLELYQTEKDPTPYAEQIHTILNDQYGLGIQLIYIPEDEPVSGSTPDSDVVEITNSPKKRKIGNPGSMAEKNLKNTKEEASIPVTTQVKNAPVPATSTTSSKEIPAPVNPVKTPASGSSNIIVNPGTDNAAGISGMTVRNSCTTIGNSGTAVGNSGTTVGNSGTTLMPVVGNSIQRSAEIPSQTLGKFSTTTILSSSTSSSTSIGSTSSTVNTHPIVNTTLSSPNPSISLVSSIPSSGCTHSSSSSSSSTPATLGSGQFVLCHQNQVQQHLQQPLQQQFTQRSYQHQLTLSGPLPSFQPRPEPSSSSFQQTPIPDDLSLDLSMIPKTGILLSFSDDEN